MSIHQAEQCGYILDMYIHGASEDFKHRIIQKMQSKHRNSSYILADTNSEKGCALMHHCSDINTLLVEMKK